jgi:hypothetical protein
MSFLLEGEAKNGRFSVAIFESVFKGFGFYVNSHPFHDEDMKWKLA